MTGPATVSAREGHTPDTALAAGETLTVPLRPGVVLQMERHDTMKDGDYYVTVRVREFEGNFEIFAHCFEPASTLILAQFDTCHAINVKSILFNLPGGAADSVRAAFPEIAVKNYCRVVA